MKLYSLYLLPKNKLYAITDNKEYMERFLSERNSKLFKVVTKKGDKEECLKILTDNNINKLQIIPLEDENGDYEIIGTVYEDDTINCVCENMAETCNHLKLYFTQNVPFNEEYKAVLSALTTISKDINFHPIIQIDSVRLFYHLFKETFVEDLIEYDDDSNYKNEILNKYKNYM